MIAAVIFDLYGTLLHLAQDSRPFHQLARRHSPNNIRAALTIALTTDNPTLWGFAARLGLPPQDDKASLDSALNHDIGHVQPFADAIPTLNALRQHGILTAVISNLATPYKRPFADHGLPDLVNVAVMSCDCGLVKPESAIYELALKRLGTAPSATIMVGDSLTSDVDGPSRVGIAGFHLSRSGRASSAERIIASLDAVLDIVR